MIKLRLTRPAWVCASYLLLHALSHVSAAWFEVSPGISIWYPPCGLALSLLVLLGPRYAGVVFVANVATALASPGLLPEWGSLFFPALITAHYTLTAWLVRRYHGTQLLPGGPRGTLVFWAAVLVSPALLALPGTAATLFFFPGIPTGFFRAALDWWIGDASGLLTVVPVAMVFVSPWLRDQALPWSPEERSGRETLLKTGRTLALVASLLVVFAVPLLRDSHAFYICFLPLIWICLRDGLPGATLALLLLTMGGLVGLRLTGSAPEFANVFLLFELAVAAVALGLGNSVSRRNEAEKKLAASQARLDRVIVGAQLGVWDWNLLENHIETNQQLATMLGYDAGELAPDPESWSRLIHPADRAGFEHALGEHFRDRTSLFEAEYRIRAKDGRWRWLQSRGSIVRRDASRRPLLVSGTLIDITDRKSAEAEARRLLAIIEATPDFILTTDEQGKALYANASLRALLDLGTDAPLDGRPLRELFPASAGFLEQTVLPAALSQGRWQGEFMLRRTDGGEIPTSQVVLVHCDMETKAVTVSFIMRDISRQKQAEAESIEHERKVLLLQKTESLGVLAGGIAHDFNNLLTAMLGNANLARMSLSPGSEAHSLLAGIESAASRAADLCQQMLAYAGRSPLAFSSLDLNQIVAETRQLLEASLSKHVAIEFKGEPQLAPVTAAAAQIQQIVMNLVINAADAIGENAGTIHLRTYHHRYAESALKGLFPTFTLAGGDYVVLVISDNGCGMTPDVQARIFEPFFTTKFDGHGLGLAAVMGIVRSHGGGIRVESMPHRGTRFEIVLPSARSDQPRPASARDESSVRASSGLVLLVDDEPGIRDVAARLLHRAGFTTIVAADGVEAVAAFEKYSDSLRLVLLDFAMPNMDGPEALGRIRGLNPNVPVILMSGFTQKLNLVGVSSAQPDGTIAKPFSYDILIAEINSVLAKTKAPAARV